MEAVWGICISILGLKGVCPLNINRTTQQQLYVAENGEVGDKVLNSAKLRNSPLYTPAVSS